MKLLYAEDERSLSEAVVDILTYHKYIVECIMARTPMIMPCPAIMMESFWIL